MSQTAFLDTEIIPCDRLLVRQSRFMCGNPDRDQRLKSHAGQPSELI